MRMQNQIRELIKLILLTILGLPLTVFAQQSQLFNFSGAFNSIGSTSVLGVPVLGQAFTGTMSYDSSQIPQNQYFYTVSAPYKIDFYINGNTIESSGFLIRDIPNSMLRFDSAATFTVNGVQVLDQTAGFYFVFFADSLNTFASLPQTISNTGYGYLSANNYLESTGFTINSVSAVPEPSECLLMICGLIFVGFTATRHKYSSSMLIAA